MILDHPARLEAGRLAHSTAHRYHLPVRDLLHATDPNARSARAALCRRLTALGWTPDQIDGHFALRPGTALGCVAVAPEPRRPASGTFPVATRPEGNVAAEVPVGAKFGEWEVVGDAGRDRHYHRLLRVRNAAGDVRTATISNLRRDHGIP